MTIVNPKEQERSALARFKGKMFHPDRVEELAHCSFDVQHGDALAMVRAERDAAALVVKAKKRELAEASRILARLDEVVIGLANDVGWNQQKATQTEAMHAAWERDGWERPGMVGEGERI